MAAESELCGLRLTIDQVWVIELRVGLYTPNYPELTGEGGIGSYTRTLATGLAERGHEVHVLTVGDGSTLFDGLVKVHTVSTRHLPIIDRAIPGAGACWRVFRAVRTLARRHQLQVFEFPNWEGYGILVPALNVLPTVVRLSTSSAEADEIDGTKFGRWQRWNVRRERWQSLAADVAITHSVVHRTKMAEEFHCGEDRIVIVPLGVPTFPNYTRPARYPGPPTIVYLGRLEHRKGTTELMQSIPKVLERVPDARFLLIGADRPHAPGGRTHARYLEQDFPAHVRQAVTFAGRLQDVEVNRHLQSADLFVAPSRYESFGLIFLEAMRWETPVLGTTAGGIPEIVEHGKSGWLVPPESPEDLAKAIVHLLQQPELRKSLGIAGRKRAESEFSVEKMASRMEAVYGEVIAKRKADR